MDLGDWHYPMAGNGHYPRNSLYLPTKQSLLRLRGPTARQQACQRQEEMARVHPCLLPTA